MSIPALDRFLDDAGVPVTGDDLLRALQHLGRQGLVQPATPSAPLAAAETAVLDRYSGVEVSATTAGRVQARTTARIALLYSHALTTHDVAELIGKSPSRVRHMAAESKLYSLPVDRRSGLLFPDWQFHENGQPLRGLATVLAALPAELHPLEVAGFFTTPSIELTVDSEHPLTPLQWLADGGPAEAVASLATHIRDAA